MLTLRFSTASTTEPTANARLVDTEPRTVSREPRTANRDHQSLLLLLLRRPVRHAFSICGTLRQYPCPRNAVASARLHHGFKSANIRQHREIALANMFGRCPILSFNCGCCRRSSQRSVWNGGTAASRALLPQDSRATVLRIARSGTPIPYSTVGRSHTQHTRNSFSVEAPIFRPSLLFLLSQEHVWTPGCTKLTPFSGLTRAVVGV